MLLPKIMPWHILFTAIFYDLSNCLVKMVANIATLESALPDALLR